MSNGKTRVQNVLMDAITRFSRVAGALESFVTAVDAVIDADQIDDPMQARGLKHLTLAQELTNLVDKDAEIQKALVQFKAAAEHDYSDQTAQNLKAAIIPMIGAVEEQISEARNLMAELSKGGQGNG